MAVVLVFRLAVAVSPFVVRACATNACDANLWANTVARFYGRIIDPAEDPDELSTDMTAAVAAASEGAEVIVTDFTGTFEGAKVAIRWSRAPSGGTVEDQAQTTLHFLKIASGAPAAWVPGTDDAAVEAAFGTLWGTVKAWYHTTVHLDVYRWSKSGPAWDLTPAPYNPAFRVTEVDVAGSSSSAQLPPQCAVTVTHKTSIRKRWGRCFLPAPTVDFLATTGRANHGGTPGTANLAAAWTTFLNACTTAHIQPVVMSRAHDAYTSPAGHPIAAQPFTAYPISTVQVDDLFDVIRSRRYSAPTFRDTGTVTPAA